MSEKRVLCHICGMLSSHTCALCGRPACEQHFDAKLGVCTSCKRGRMMKK